MTATRVKEISITLTEDENGVASVDVRTKNIINPIEVLGILQYTITHQSIVYADEGNEKLHSVYKKMRDNNPANLDVSTTAQ